MRGLLLLGLVGCSFDAPGTTGACPPDETLCGDRCVSLSTNEHCGACGAVCNGQCEAGTCISACELGLSSRVVDAWGTVWDGVDRAALPLADAEVTCASFGGRLPRASDLYRARSTSSEPLVGSTSASLWSSAAEDARTRISVSLSDGASLGSPPEAAVAFRCVCSTGDDFVGAACNGPPDAPCFPSNGTQVDARDRIALRKGAAIGECASAGGKLAEPLALVEALQAGAPGSGNVLHSADRSTFYQSSGIVWTGAMWTGEVSGVAGLDVSLAAPFRCEGRADLASRQDPEPAGTTFALPDGTHVDAADRAPQAWELAHDACLVDGGHLPRSAELARAIDHGLPGGSNMFLWTTDQTGYHPSVADFLAAVLRWTGVDRQFSYRFNAAAPPDTITWVGKTAALAFRCIYYPVDPAIAMPTGCSGGCFEVVPLAASPARTWLDSVDRPAAVFDRAIDQCRLLGGHLASERDLTEAIRRGLPNGSSVALWTSELAQGYVQIVAWAGVKPAFADQYALGEMTWDYPAPTTAKPYRCMWTNELR